MSSEGYGIISEYRRSGSEVFPVISEDDQIRQSIYLLLTIRKGERPLEPMYGNELHNFLFLPNSAYLRKQIEQHLLSVIRDQEPRAKDVNVSVDSNPHHPTVLEIAVQFTTQNESSVSNLHLALNLQGGGVTYARR